MSAEEILEILGEAKPAISTHWASCLESGLEGHTPARTRQVDQALEAYFQAIAEPGAEILDAMKALFARLDEINDDSDGALLETDERELLVPVIIDGAVAAGLDLSGYEDGDPTGEFRNF